MSEKLELNECCLCGSTIGGMGYGNNPFPMAEKGRCCDDCNLTKVIPARLADIGSYMTWEPKK